MFESILLCHCSLLTCLDMLAILPEPRDCHAYCDCVCLCEIKKRKRQRKGFQNAACPSHLSFSKIICVTLTFSSGLRIDGRYCVVFLLYDYKCRTSNQALQVNFLLSLYCNESNTMGIIKALGKPIVQLHRQQPATPHLFMQ